MFEEFTAAHALRKVTHKVSRKAFRNSILQKPFAKACAEPATLAAHDDSVVVGGGVQIRGALGSAKGFAKGVANGLANGFANIV